MQCYAMVQAVSHRPGSSPGQSTWDIWCTKLQWSRIFSEYLTFPLPVSFHQRSISIFILMLLLS